MSTPSSFFDAFNSKLFFMTNETLETQEKTNSNPSPNANLTPPEGKFGSVDLFIRKCRHDIRKLNFSQTIKFSNLDADEWAALKSFRSRKDVTIKPADKGGAVVVACGVLTFTNKKPPVNLPTPNFMSEPKKTSRSTTKKSSKPQSTN